MMCRLLEFVRKRKKEILFYGCAVILFYGMFFQIDFATDSYFEFSQNPVRVFLSNGRFIGAGFFALVKELNLSDGLIYKISFCLAIFSTVVSMIILDEMIRRRIKNKNLVRILTLLIVLNPFLIELYLFLEKGVMCLGILCSILAVKFLVNFLENRNKKDLFKAIMVLFLAVSSYQGVIGIYLVLMVIHIISQNNDYRKKIKEIILAGVIYVSVSMINIVITKMLGFKNRAGGDIVIGESLKKIISGTKELIGGFNLMPENTFFWMTIFTVGIIVALIFRAKKDKLKRLGGVFLVFISAVAAAVAPQVILATNSIFICPRSTYAYGGIIGLIMLIFYLTRREKVSFRAEKIGIIAGMIFLGLQFYGATRIITDHYETIALDRERAKQIISMIRDYESEKEIKVEKFVVNEDSRRQKSYDGIFVSKNINNSAFWPNWSQVEIIEYYSGEKYDKAEDKDFKKFCRDRDWKYFEREQIEFQGNVVKMCLY